MVFNEPHFNVEQTLQDLSRIHFDFFQAIREGPEGTAGFADRLEAFAQLVQDRDEELREEDYKTRLTNIHEAAFTISTVASGLHEISEFADQLTTELTSDIAHLFTTLSLDNSPNDITGVSYSEITRPTPANSTSSLSSSSFAIDNHSPYQLLSCQWLLDNIHNPYPSAATKLQIAEEAGVTHKLVSEWFSQSRRRIGWTSFLKRRFNGNRQLCVDSAQRVLIEGAGPSSYEYGIIDDLFSIKRKAERLYKDKAACSDLAKELEKTIPTVTFGKESLKGRKRQRVLDDNTESCNKYSDANKCYPASVLHTSKRRKKSTFSTQLPLTRTASLSSSVSSRSSTVDLTTPTIPYLPLPTSVLDDAVEKWVSSLSTELAENHAHINKRSKKRSFSDSNSRGSEKRPRLAEPETSWLTIPSDSLHCTSSSNENDSLNLSTHFNFDLPPAASFESALLSGSPLHVDLFDYASCNPNEHNEIVPWKMLDDCQPKAAAGNMAIFTPGDIPEFPHAMARSELLEGIHVDALHIHSYASGDVNPDIHKKQSYDAFDTVTSSSDTGGISLSATANNVDEEWLMKLTRINDLLAEAAQLQSEVFG